MPEPDLPVIDEATLTELMTSTGDDHAFVGELVQTFLADAPAQLDAMTAAVEADDAPALVRPAHTLKSSSATVGAMRLSSVARDLEMAGRGGRLEPTIRDDLEVARAEWRSAAAALDSWLRQAAAE
jgi:histidine phosphotransfer protein HptB